MGEFVIECFESGAIDYSTARILILLHDPVWEPELFFAAELLRGS